MFGGDLTAKHNKIKETEMVRILGIVVLAHEGRKQIDFGENSKRSEAISQLVSVQLLFCHILSGGVNAAFDSSLQFNWNALGRTVVVQ